MLQPDKLKKLNENALKMSEAGKSKEDILAMKDAFIKQFGNEEPVKKKVPTEIGISTSTSQNQKLVSGQVDGSLGLPKQQLSQNDLDNLNNLPKQKFRIPELPKNLKKVIDNPENKARFDNLKKQELLKYKQSTSLTDLDAKEVENELADAKNKNGLLNKAKSAFGSLGNFLTTGAFTETDLLETEKKEAKNKLIQQGIKKPTEEQINKTADELFTKKKIEGRQNDKIASYLENLDPQTKNILGADAEIKYKTLDKEIAKATDRIQMNKIALEDFADALNDPNTLPQDREIIQKEMESIAKQIDSDFKYYNSNTAKIGSLKEEFEVFRKNYNTMDNLAMRVGTSIVGVGTNLISATGYLSSLDFSNPISQIRSIQTQEFVNDTKQKIEKTKEGFRPESEELNADNWANYVTDVLANQSGTLLTLATTGGVGGATLLGVGGAGEKYNEMYNENKKGAGYSPLQMAVTPFLSGASTAILSELPTAKTLMGTKRLFMSAINEGKKEIIDQAVKQTSQKIAKQVFDNYKREISTELLDNLVQNTIDKDILGKDVGYWDNTWKTLKDTAVMTTFFSSGALPHVAISGVKMFTKPEQNKTLDNNGKKIVELSKQLDNPNLDETSKKAIENQIDKATVENSEIVNSTLDKIANLPNEDVKKVVDNNSREEKIKLEAQAVKENETIDPTAKKIVLDGLKKEFTEVQEQTKSIIDAETKPQEVAEQKPQTQPQAKEQEKVAEVEQLRAKEQAELKEVFPNAELNSEGKINVEKLTEEDKVVFDKIYDKYDKLITPLLENETTSPSNLESNASIQPRVEPMGEMGVEQKPTAEVVAEESVQSANNVRPIEGETKITQEPTLEDISNFLNEKFKSNEANNPTKEKSSKKDTDLRSATKQSAESEQKEVEVAKKWSLQGRTPMNKRKFKGDMAKANAIEPSDVRSMVLSHFLRGAKVASSEISQQGELKAKNNGFYGIATSKGKTIDAIVHDIWESQENGALKIDTSTIKDMVLEIISKHNRVQDISDSILKDYGIQSSQNQQEFEEDLQVYQEVLEEEKPSEKDLMEANLLLAQMSDAEILELVSEQEKSYEDYLKDLEERQVVFEFGPFVNQRGTIQPDGSIITGNGEFIPKQAISKIEYINKKEVEKPTTSESKQAKPDATLLKEVDEKIQQAREKVRVAKDALDRKAKSLDKEMVKDQENLFGERKSSAEAKLFDERVDAQAREKATETERNNIKTAQDELKKLIQTKKDIESGKITSNQIDLEDVVNEENKQSDNFSLNGKDTFYHASNSKRKGRLKESNAPQFGTGVYFSTDKSIVEEEFGKGNTTEVKLKVQNPVYTNTKQWTKVETLAIEMADKDYGKRKELTLDEDQDYFRYDKNNLSEVAEIPSKFISDSAKSLGYDVIIDEGSTQYGDEIVVLDESKIIYEEDNIVSEKQQRKEKANAEVDTDLVSKEYYDKFQKDFPNTLLAIEEKNGLITIFENGETREVEDYEFVKELKNALAKGYKGIGKVTRKVVDTETKKLRANAEVDKIADKIKDLLPGIKDPDLKKQGFSQDQLIDLVANAVKNLISAGIEIDEAIRQVSASIKERFNIDVNIDDVKAKLEPKVEQEPFERKEGKKSVLTRATTGNNSNLKKAISKYSLDYEIESQETAKANAEKFVAEVGIEDAFTAVKSNQIPGAEGAFVYAEIIRQINDNLESFTDEELIQYEESNMELLGEVTKMLDEKSRSAGRFISALGNIYQSSDGMYNLSIQVKNYKAQNGGTIPADILEKFTEANEKIKELEKQIEEAKKIREEQESVRSIEEIIESISRKNKIDRSKPISDKAKAKAFADKLRSFKTTAKGTLNASTPFSLAFDGAIEIIATSIEAGGKISDAIKQGVDYIRKQNLNKDEENQAIAQVFNAFEESERVQRGIRLDDEGKLRIPHSILREKVEEGITNVNDLVTAIKADVDELFPDEQFTERQVRDAITQYGKTTNPTKDEIEIEISVMKSLGKLISGMEDAYDGKRPARSGLQRRPLTTEERTQMRKLKELLRDLPMDDADLQRTWKTALDAIKSRLTNEITDLDQQIANGEKRKGEKKAIEYDAEANALKAERDQKRQLLDELVGKPELTEEERINKAEILLEKSIIDLQEKIDAGDIAYKSKPTPLNSEKLKSLREQKKALQQTMEQMRQDAGLAEMKRLQIAKNARIKRIAELKRRLDEKDFSKKERKPLPIDAELAQLEAEAMELKEVYDKEVYKLELKNQTQIQKFGKRLLEVLNIPKILSFTIDMSFIGIQGGIQFYRLVRTNPKKAMTIFTNTVKAMFNAKTENRYANELKSNPNYTLWRKSKLAITEVNYKTSAQEELFQHNIINGTLDSLGDKLQEKGYAKLGAFVREYLNFTKIFERGQTYFLNQMRINRFDEGATILRTQGKNELDDLAEYEKVASAVNTLTGRANTSQSSVLANLRSLNGTLFSSFANWLSVINQLNPYWYTTLTPTARKMALSDLFHFVGAVGGFMTLATLASSDDDEPFTVETDPRSSDFMLLKKGNLRIDPWQTKKSHAVFMARMLPYIGGVKNKDGEIVEFGVDRNDKNRLELAWQYMSNKFSPGVSNLIQYTSLTEEKEYGGVTFRENKFGEDYKMSKMFVPLYIQSLKEVAEEQPNAFGKSVSVLNYLGLVNLSIYGDKEGVRDRPDFDENGNKTVKSEKFSFPKPPSPPRP